MFLDTQHLETIQAAHYKCKDHEVQQHTKQK